MGSAPRTESTASVGGRMERLAGDFLARQGLRAIAHNHRCRFGEIDLVATDGAVLVFVEVRYRESSRFGTAAETVDSKKQRRLAAAAAHYLQGHPSMLPCRFDVVAINGQDEIHWVRDAFAVTP